jgi:hypothetical protein
MFEDFVEQARQVAAEHAVVQLEFENSHERGIKLFEVGDGDPAGVFRGKSFGIGAFHEPSAGAPGAFCGVADGIERGDFGFAFGVAEFSGKFRVAAGFSADGADVTADVTCRAFEAAAVRDKGADFVAFGFVEGAGAAGRGRGAWSGVWEVWSGEHGELVFRIADVGLALTTKSTKRHEKELLWFFVLSVAK